MGLKMSFAVLRAIEPDVAFTAESVHDPDAAHRIAPILLPDCEPVGTATLGDAMYSDRLMIGAYGTSMMIGDPRLFAAGRDAAALLTDQIADLLPAARCVTGVMQNVCDRMWVRAVENGYPIREFGAGCSGLNHFRVSNSMRQAQDQRPRSSWHNLRRWLTRAGARSVTPARRVRCPHGIRPAPPRSGWAGCRPRRSGIPRCRPGRRRRS